MTVAEHFLPPKLWRVYNFGVRIRLNMLIVDLIVVLFNVDQEWI